MICRSVCLSVRQLFFLFFPMLLHANIAGLAGLAVLGQWLHVQIFCFCPGPVDSSAGSGAFSSVVSLPMSVVFVPTRGLNWQTEIIIVIRKVVEVPCPQPRLGLYFLSNRACSKGFSRI